ncbi:MAG: hypothetical protein JST20_12985 [Bacteroidetes bacterium]|nr:hypothetical protein [Bacteroidota bacterium]
MPTIINNNFSGDSLDMRSERLGRLSANVATHATTLGLSSTLLTKAQGAAAAWQAARVSSQTEQGESVSFYEIFHADFIEVAEQYQLVKDYLLALIANQPRKLKETSQNFGIAVPTPTTWETFRIYVIQLIEKNAEFVTDNNPVVAPPSAITLLQDLLDTAVASYKVAQRESTEASEAFDSQQDLFAEDTAVLQLIFQQAKMTLGKKNPLLEDLGFAPIASQNGGGPVPASPSGLNFSGETLSWTSVSGATSYGISLSYDGGTHWEGDFNSDTNSSVVPVAEVGKLYYRVRARNANGYGEYSGTFEHLFGLSAADNFAYADDQFTWNPVEFANGYDIQYSLANEENWVLIFNGNATSFAHTPASGSWTYRIRASYGSIKSEWVEIAVEQV